MNRRQPLQFNITSLMVLTAVVGVLFGTLSWLGVSPLASSILLAVITVSLLAGVGLLAVIAQSGDDDPDER